MIRVSGRILCWCIALACAYVPIGGQVQGQNLDLQQLRTALERLADARFNFKGATQQTAVDVAFGEVTKVREVDIAAGISETAAGAFLADSLRSQTKFSSPRLRFAAQTASVALDFTDRITIDSLGPIDVKARLNASVAPAIRLATDQPNVEFRVSLAVTRLDAEVLSVTQNGRPLPAANILAQGLLSGMLVPAEALLSRVEFRLPTVIATKINLTGSSAPGVSTSFRPDNLRPRIQIAALAHLIDGGRLTVIAYAGRPSAQRTAVPVGSPAFDTLRSTFRSLLTASNVSWIDQGDFSAYLDVEFLDEQLSQVLAAGPICLQASLDKLPTPVHTKLKFPPTRSIDCTPTKDCTPTRDCTPSRNCDAELDCTPKRDCSAVKDCGGYKWYQAPDKTRCEVEKSAAKLDCERIKGTEKLQCEATKVGRKADCERLKSQEKGQCEVEKTGERSLCETLKAVGKPACEGFKAIYDQLKRTGTDYGSIDSDDMAISGTATLCLTKANLDPKSMSLTAKLTAQAKAQVTGRIKFTPLNSGHLLCVAPVRERVDTEVSLPDQPIDVHTTVTITADGKRAAAVANVTSAVHIRFPFSTALARLIADPAFAVTCPIPATLSTIRVATPDQWWPKQARGDIEKNFKPLKLEFDLAQRPLQAGPLKLSGTLMHNNKGMGGSFTIAK